jgi:hypothetical protein
MADAGMLPPLAADHFYPMPALHPAVLKLTSAQLHLLNSLASRVPGRASFVAALTEGGGAQA